MSEREKIWLIRSVSVPVNECLSMPWKDFMKLLHGAWRESTDLANWASHTLRLNDVTRTPAMKELPTLKPVDLYALAFGRAKPGKPRKEGRGPLPVVEAQYGGTGWDGCKIAAASLLRWVDRKYRKERGKIIWRRERRTPEFLYPVPFPVHQQIWDVWLNERNQPVIAVQLPGGRVSLRLRQGPEFVRAMKILQQIEAGEVAKQELKICRQRSFARARLDEQRAPGGGHRETYRVMLRISYRIEAAVVADDGIAECKTGKDPFVTLTIPGSHNWVLHAPWAQNWITEHRRFLDCFADDLKFEKRWPARKRKNLNRYRERRCEKHARRMKSFIQQTAAQIVGHAKRNKIGRLLWDATDRSFAESFPWFQLEAQIQNKCDEMGIVLQIVASGDVVKTVEVEQSAASAD